MAAQQTETASQPEDVAPRKRGPRSVPAGTDEAFTGYKGKYGVLKTNMVATYGMVGAGLTMMGQGADGMLFTQCGEPCADAWIEAGKADPRIMRVLQIVWGSPLMQVIAAHSVLVMGIAANHGVSILSLFNPLAAFPPTGATRTDSPPADTSVSSASSPLPYVPVGANAPTDTRVPSLGVVTDVPLSFVPDVQLPKEIEQGLRQVAKQTGRPIEELRQEAMVLIAQEMAGQNGHTTQAGALGAPIAKE